MVLGGTDGRVGNLHSRPLREGSSMMSMEVRILLTTLYIYALYDQLYISLQFYIIMGIKSMTPKGNNL